MLQDTKQRLRTIFRFVVGGLVVLILLGIVGQFFSGIASSVRDNFSFIGVSKKQYGEASYESNLGSADSGSFLGLVRTTDTSSDTYTSAPRSESYDSNTTTTVTEGKLTQRKVIRNGSLSLLVKEAESVAKKIHSIATQYKGFVSQSRVYEVSDGVKSGNVTIRIPAADFYKALGEIKALAIKVENEQVDADDVTEQYIDLQAQLRNLQAEEQQYLEIMKSAKTVEETLQVSERLASVRGRIEQIQGQLQYLERQVDMSTISIYLTAEADVEVFGVRWRPLYELKRAFRDMIEGLTNYADSMFRFILSLPVIILWVVTIGVIVIIAFRILRWFARRFLSFRHFFQKNDVKKNGKKNGVSPSV